MNIKPFHKAHTRVSVECHVSLTNTIEWLPGRVDSIVSAIDRPYRLNVKLDNGGFITEAAPECVEPLPTSAYCRFVAEEEATREIDTDWLDSLHADANPY